VAGVLRDLSAAELAFLRELLEIGPDHRQQLQNDRRADVGHDAQREDRHLGQVAAREHVVQPEHAVARELFSKRFERREADARNRDHVADGIHGQQAKRKQDTLPQIRDGKQVLQAVVHASCSVLPPAAAIFSAAFPLNLCARTVSALPTSPRASTFTLRPPPCTSPCSRSSSGVTTVPASNLRARRSRLTTAYSTRNGLWNPRFGTRRCSGIWPPSNPRLNLKPDRDFAPLCPRPAVLPLPEPSPRPMRFFALFMPRGGLRSCRPISVAHFNEVPHLVDHAAHGGRVFQLHRVADPQQTEAAHHGALVAVESRWTLDQRHLDGVALNVGSVVCHQRFLFRRPAAAYTAISAMSLPRSRAIRIGSFSD